MYSLDKKSIKTLPENIAELIEKIKPLADILSSNKKTNEEVAKLLDEYMSHTEEILQAAEDNANEKDNADENNDKNNEGGKSSEKKLEEKIPNKLNSLKKNNK